LWKPGINSSRLHKIMMEMWKKSKNKEKDKSDKGSKKFQTKSNRIVKTCAARAMRIMI